MTGVQRESATAVPGTPDTTQIRARADAATPGPWYAEADSFDGWGVVQDDAGPGTVYIAERMSQPCATGEEGEADAEFIAAARTDVPALCKALDAANTEVARQAKVIEAVRARTFASDDGTEHEHNHEGGGESECPACWVLDIRAALDSPAKTEETP